MRKIHKHPIFTSVICFSKNALFTVKRTVEPYEDFYALPESPVGRDETLEQAAIRTLKDASGLTGTKMKLIGIYDDIDTGERRLPGVRSYIVSYIALNWIGEIPLEGCRWISDWRGEQLAFDHNLMVLESEQVIEMANKSRYLYAL